MAIELELIKEGKKLSIPKQAIDYAIAKLHIGTSEEEVAKYIADRIGKAKVAWPNNAVKDAVNYALDSHRKNQNLYGDVMAGNIGNKKERKKKDETPVVESNEYYDLIKATIESKPLNFKDTFIKIIGPKVVDAVLDMKESIKREMYKEQEEIISPKVNNQAKSILGSYSKSNK